MIEGHSIGDGIIVAALAGAFIAYLYFKHLDRQRRLEIIHAERLAAMDKGIPLPELPLDPVKLPRPPDPRRPARARHRVDIARQRRHDRVLAGHEGD